MRNGRLPHTNCLLWEVARNVSLHPRCSCFDLGRTVLKYPAVMKHHFLRKVEKNAAINSYTVFPENHLPHSQHTFHSTLNEFVKQFMECILPNFLVSKCLQDTLLTSYRDHKIMVIRNEELIYLIRPNTCMSIYSLLNNAL